jgi:AraC-like DNA-binding protein
MEIKRYKVINSQLNKLIKYFWVINSSQDLFVNHNLLPVGNIDIILNFSSPIKYIMDGSREITPRGVHFNGIQSSKYGIQQSGKLNVVGISFFPTGLYPILHIPLSEFTNQTIELVNSNQRLSEALQNRLTSDMPISKKLATIEKALIQSIKSNYLPPDYILKVVNNLFVDYTPLELFCNQYGIHKRTLERIFAKYVGITPKSFQKICRFQRVLSKMIQDDNSHNLTKLAVDYDYYDQSHFLKEFKSFTGLSPLQFINKSTSIKEIMN